MSKNYITLHDFQKGRPIDRHLTKRLKKKTLKTMHELKNSYQKLFNEDKEPEKLDKDNIRDYINHN